MADDLNAPLGLNRRTRRWRVPKAVPNAVAGLLLAAVAIFAGWAIVVDDPLGGEPVVLISTETKPPQQTAAANDAAPGSAKPAAANAAQAKPTAAAVEKPASGSQTVTIIDGTSGRREQVVVGTGQDKPSEPPAAGSSAPGGPRIAAAASTNKAPTIDTRLAEQSRHGAIPKVAADGTRSADLYARAPDQVAVSGAAPRVAVVIGRLGIGAAATSDAMAKLPTAITFAFPPYATDLERWVARARGEGREVLLQVPMEPYDFPDNDPGPQTLLTSLSPEQNLDRLHWAMSRFQGYVGLANYMGARFATNETAVGAVVREAGKRGLLYFDDATAARSVAGQVAGASNVPFARADIVLDAAPTIGEIDAALAKLEALARERGMAVGAAGALPVSIDRIARWAKAAAARGIVLVPISTIANKPKSS